MKPAKDKLRMESEGGPKWRRVLSGSRQSLIWARQTYHPEVVTELRAATIEELAESPVGRYVAGPTYAHFCVSPAFWGILLWGRPNEEDARQLGRTLVLELDPPAIPHVSLVDASRLEGGDVSAFALLQRYLERHSEALARQVLRLALVHPKGLEGAIVAGAYEVLPRPYAVKLFAEIEAALGWLDIDPATAVALANVHATASSTPPLMGALRSWLDAHLAEPTIGAAAGALALSERSLQRKLHDLEATFQEEVAEARVRAAKRLLLDGDASLTTIALEVGCASPQHFSQLFRRLTGESPSAWRTKSRKA
jgi:AraC-like DNA-binding protein